MNRLSTLVLLVLGSWTCAAGAADRQEGAPPPASAEEAAMMQAMEAAAAVGAQHRRLARSVGKFTAATESWGEPGGEPMRSQMQVERRLELGGRVLEEHWRGDMMGMPFEGIGRTGYDNVTARYWTTWTDNLSTGIYLAWGHWDEDRGLLVFEGDAVDPVSGQAVPTRTEVRYLDGGDEAMTMYQVIDGEEHKTMAFMMTRD